MKATAPGLLGVYGVGADTGAILLVAARDNAARIRSEAAWAHLCGVAPIPAGSGKTNGRHRLNPGGNRQANHALWRIVVTRLGQGEPRTVAYMQRRLADSMAGVATWRSSSTERRRPRSIPLSPCVLSRIVTYRGYPGRGRHVRSHLAVEVPGRTVPRGGSMRSGSWSSPYEPAVPRLNGASPPTAVVRAPIGRSSVHVPAVAAGGWDHVRERSLRAGVTSGTKVSGDATRGSSAEDSSVVPGVKNISTTSWASVCRCQ